MDSQIRKTQPCSEEEVVGNHELNRVLAEVAGVKVRPAEYAPNKTWLIASEGFGRWDPIHDANQMEIIKNALKLSAVEYVITSAHLVNLYIVRIICGDETVTRKHKSELMAFALAVYAMEQVRKNHEQENPKDH